jgi:polyisoprenoid-binding protein YceI
MKNSRYLCLAFTAMLAFATVAAGSGSRNIEIHYDTSVAGTHLSVGTYDVQVQNHNTTATVSFSKKGKVIATVEAKVVDRGTAYRSNQVVYNLAGNGGKIIQELRFKGSSEVVAFE